MESIRRTMVDGHLVLLDKISVITPLVKIGRIQIDSVWIDKLAFSLVVDGYEIQLVGHKDDMEKARADVMMELGWVDDEERETTEDRVCL